MSENLINITSDSNPSVPIIKKPPTIADFKINDEMIILSKKIDDTIAINIKNKEKLFGEADFIENQYLWAIEDLEGKLAKKIVTLDHKQKFALKKIDPDHIVKAISLKKLADFNFIKAKNKVLIDRISISDSTLEIKNSKINSLNKGQALEFEKLDKAYAILTTTSLKNQNLSHSNAIKLEHDRNINSLKKDFENSKKELLKLDAQSITKRKKEALNLRYQYKPLLLSFENVTVTQVNAYNTYMGSRQEAKKSSIELEKSINILSRDKTRSHIKAVNKAEIFNKKFQDLLITRTKLINKEEGIILGKSRLSSINEGIKNNTNTFKQYVDEKMLVDLVPSYHTYKINPLILPNNTFKAHNRNGMYKGIKFTLPIFGIAIGIFLMVLYSLFSFQATLLWIETGVSSLGNASESIIAFQANATSGFAELYRIWGLDNNDIWNTILAFGILIIIFSAFTITIRSNTLWSYISISTLFIFLIIGFALMLVVILNMGFGNTVVGENNLLTMVLFRQIIAQVEDATNNPTYLVEFEKLINSLGGNIPIWQVAV